MTFQPEQLDAFLAVFDANKENIRAVAGCERLELLQDIHQPAIIMTYSYWNSEADLENYRHSDLFKSVWSKTKPLFAERPQAWSVNKRVVLD